MIKWKYFESGNSGYTQITSPEIPNPNAVPIDLPTVSTRVSGQLATGERFYLYPETKYIQEPVTFTYNYQSGAAEIVDKFKDLRDNTTKVKIQSDVPGEEWVVRINEVNERKRLHGEEDYRDIMIVVDWLDE